MTRRSCGALVAAAVALGACGGSPAVAVSLANAAKPARLPYVVACWEREFKDSPPSNGYVAEVDFVVEGKTSRFHGAHLRSLHAVDADGKTATASGREAALGACVTAALDLSALPVTADDDGPGFTTPDDLQVKRFRIAFVDASAKRRTAASARQANTLLGPRSDRCQGLYAHDPPRDASTLYGEISRAEAQAGALHAQAGPGDRDLEARELQKAYDGELELIERLTADLGQPEIPEANRKRLRDALDAAREAARRFGARIGCKR